MLNNNFDIRRLGNICIYIVLILVNISYCPGIILTSNYNIMIAIITFAMVLNLVLNLGKDWFYGISMYIYYGLFSLIICSIVFLFNDVFIFQDTFNIYLSITCFLTGYCAFNHELYFIDRCKKIFVLSSLFLGLYSVINNLGAFTITEQYAFSIKNSSGVLLASGIIICMFIINKSSKFIHHIFWGAIMVLLCLCLLTFRSRAAIISVLISMIIYLYKRKVLLSVLKNPFVLILFSILLLLIYIFDIIHIDYIYDSLFANKDVSSLDSVTSGRLSTYKKGLQVFNECPLLGNALLNKHLPPIDNFIISQLSHFGMMGLLLLLPAYLFVWYICIFGIIKSRIDDLLPYLLLFIICMISFTEGPFPFGPGSAVFCAWFMYGWWKKRAIVITTSNNYGKSNKLRL